jgi:hypothetical protein
VTIVLEGHEHTSSATPTFLISKRVKLGLLITGPVPARIVVALSSLERLYKAGVCWTCVY